MSRKAEKEKVGGGESSKSTGRSGEDVEGCMRVCLCVWRRWVNGREGGGGGWLQSKVELLLSTCEPFWNQRAVETPKM